MRILLIALLLASTAYGGKGSSSGWSSSSSSSSRPSSSSSSSSSKPSSSGWGSSSSKPSTSSSSSSKPSTSLSSSSGWGSTVSKSGNTASGSSGWGSSSSSTVKTTTPQADKTPISVSKKPAAPTFDKVAASDSKKAESRANYEKSTTPASTYKTPKGNEVKIDPKDKQVEYLRGRLDQQQWVNRQQRTDTFYSSYRGPAYVPIMYGDPYHGMFNYWLLSQSIDTMAMFIYHHQATMDQARINDLYAKNAQLQARVNAMSGQRDSTWMPKNVDPDLCYNDEYVNSVYNPQPKEIDEYEYDSGYRFWHWVWFFVRWILYIALTIVIICVITELLFIKTY